MLNEFLQILLGGVKGGADQVVAKDTAAAKIAQQLEIEKQKRAQAFQDNVALKLIDPKKTNPNVTDLGALGDAYPAIKPLLDSMKPKSLGGTRKSTFTRDAQPSNIIDLNQFVK